MRVSVSETGTLKLELIKNDTSGGEETKLVEDTQLFIGDNLQHRVNLVFQNRILTVHVDGESFPSSVVEDKDFAFIPDETLSFGKKKTYLFALGLVHFSVLYFRSFREQKSLHPQFHIEDVEAQSPLKIKADGYYLQ